MGLIAMSGDCIKMRTDLSEDPAVIAMAMRLKIDEFGIVGRLHRIWSWADTHLSDGRAMGVTLAWIDGFVRCEGFSKALIGVGWLAQIDNENLIDSLSNVIENGSDMFIDSYRNVIEGGDLGGVFFPKFFRYQEGKPLTTKTKTKTTPTRESEIDKKIDKKLFIENGGIDKSINVDKAFIDFWKSYPRKDAKVQAQKAFSKVNPSAELMDKIMSALDTFKNSDQWRREDGKYITYASSWLNQRRWEDLEDMASASDSPFEDAL